MWAVTNSHSLAPSKPVRAGCNRKEVESSFSTEDHFHKADFIPKSDYAQHYFTVKMLQEVARQNRLFQSIPIELQETVALFTTSPTFSEEDARHIFNNS